MIYIHTYHFTSSFLVILSEVISQFISKTKEDNNKLKVGLKVQSSMDSLSVLSLGLLLMLNLMVLALELPFYIEIPAIPD